MTDDQPLSPGNESRKRALRLLQEALDLLDQLDLKAAAARLSMVIDDVSEAVLRH